MSIRYTLRYLEKGKEVWKRYSGDREEMLRDLAATLPDLDVNPTRAVNFAMEAHDINPEALAPGQQQGAVVLTNDFTGTVAFDVYRTNTPTP